MGRKLRSILKGDYITTEQVLDVLCRLIPESKLIRNSVITLDSYTGLRRFNTVWQELFLVYAKQVYVTVTADEAAGIWRKMGESESVYMSRQMANCACQRSLRK